jgi:ribonuclease HI
MNKYYAVKVGRLTGIFNTWKECEQQVRGFSGSKYKSFKTNHEATNWLKEIPNEVLHTQIVNTEISYTEVWTDGSALNNSRSSEYSLAGIGVFFGDDHPNNKSLPLPGVFQTNQRAEIYAVIVALEVIGSNTPVIVYTDSKYVIDG